MIELRKNWLETKLSKITLSMILIASVLDSALNIQIGGYNVRGYQIVLLSVFPLVVATKILTDGLFVHVNRNALPLLLWFVLLFFGVLWTPEPDRAGLLTLVFSIVMTWTVMFQFGKSLSTISFLKIGTMGFGLLLLTGLVQWIGYWVFEFDFNPTYEIKQSTIGNMRGFYYESNWFSLAALTTGFLFLGYIRSNYSSSFKIIISEIIVFGILVIAEARGVMGAYLIFRIVDVFRRHGFTASLLVSLLIISAYTGMSGIRALTLPTSFEDPSGVSRFVALESSLSFQLQRPFSISTWFGHGIGSWRQYYKILDINAWRDISDLRLGYTGSSFLASTLVEQGIIGILLWVASLFYAARVSDSVPKIWITYSIASFFVASVFYPSFNQLQYFVFLPAGFGVLFAGKNEKTET